MKLNSNINSKSFSVIILAGGNSTRMGFPKPWLLKGNATFLLGIINTYQLLGINDIIVVLNKNIAMPEWENELNEVKSNATVIINSFSKKGRLYSLYLGLQAVKLDSIFIHNVDNPFIESEVLAALISQTENDKITIPTYLGQGGHPVIINRIVKEEVLNNYPNYETLKEVFSNFPQQRIEVKSNSVLKNINTPQELEAHKYELV